MRAMTDTQTAHPYAYGGTLPEVERPGTPEREAAIAAERARLAEVGAFGRPPAGRRRKPPTRPRRQTAVWLVDPDPDAPEGGHWPSVKAAARWMGVAGNMAHEALRRGWRCAGRRLTADAPPWWRPPEPPAPVVRAGKHGRLGPPAGRERTEP